MSRCFPYPPPGYYRNGATYDALIESIKPQKETKPKTERKIEKKAKKEKKEKRQKEKRNNEDSHNFTDVQIKKTKAITELFEKSDLTEEYGQAISPHQPSYSSDSTQNSNKRKRDEYSLLPDSSAGHGSFKIRFLKKQKGSVSTSFVADVRSNTRIPVPLSSNSDRTLVSCFEKNGVLATSGRENRTQYNSNSIPEATMISDQNRLHFGRIQLVSSSAKPSHQSSRPQQQVPSRVHLQQEVPSLSVSRNIDEQGLHSGGQQPPTQSHNGMLNQVSNIASTSAAAGRSGCGLMNQKEDPRKAGLTRSEKKILKKQAKYEKLIGRWLPPVLPTDLPDDDWLSNSNTLNSSISKSGVETCREAVASWQPCARFLAEVDIHALPYTVPF